LTDKDCGDCPKITESKIRVIISNSFWEITQYQWFWGFDNFRIITFGIIPFSYLSLSFRCIVSSIE
jgi:hypothetical protein